MMYGGPQTQLLHPLRFASGKNGTFRAYISGNASTLTACSERADPLVWIREEMLSAILWTEKQLATVEDLVPEDTFALPGKNSGLFEYRGVMHYLWSIDPVRTEIVAKSSPHGNKTFPFMGSLHNSAHLLELKEHGVYLGLAHGKQGQSDSTSAAKFDPELD